MPVWGASLAPVTSAITGASILPRQFSSETAPPAVYSSPTPPAVPACSFCFSKCRGVFFLIVPEYTRRGASYTADLVSSPRSSATCRTSTSARDAANRTHDNALCPTVLFRSPFSTVDGHKRSLAPLPFVPSCPSRGALSPPISPLPALRIRAPRPSRPLREPPVQPSLHS